jgi:hypothetical protein
MLAGPAGADHASAEPTSSACTATLLPTVVTTAIRLCSIAVAPD